MNYLLITAVMLAQHYGSHSGGSGAGDGPARSEWGQNGFVDRDDVSISFDDGTRTFTVAPVATSFEFYDDGIRYDKQAADSVVIADSEGTVVFYYSGTTLSSALNPTLSQVDSYILDECIVGAVYWDATNKTGLTMADMRHGTRMGPSAHVLFHNTYGSQFGSGMALGDFASDQDGSLDAHAQFSVAAGEHYNIDIVHTPSAVASTVGLQVFYIDGLTFRSQTNAGFSVVTTGTGRLAYNNAGALAEVNNNDFVLYHIFTSNLYNPDGTGEAIYFSFMGQAQYATIGAARTGANNEIITLLTLVDRRIPASLPIATVIYQTSNSYSNSVMARIRTNDDGDDWVDWRRVTGLPVPQAQ